MGYGPQEAEPSWPTTDSAEVTPSGDVAAASTPLELHTWLDAIAEIARAANRPSD